MKVTSVNFNNMVSPRYKVTSVGDNQGQEHLSGNVTTAEIPYILPIEFRGQKEGGQAKLKKLYAHGLPCMYSGTMMIDSKEVTRWINNNIHEAPAKDVLNVLECYKDGFDANDKKLLNQISELAQKYPKLTVKELLKKLEPDCKKQLLNSQLPVIKELKVKINFLPEKYKNELQNIISENEAKLKGIPMKVPFSINTFKYKFEKINEDIQNTSDNKAKHDIYKIKKQFYEYEKTIKNIHNTPKLDSVALNRLIKPIEQIMQNSSLKDNEQLTELITLSKAQLRNEPIVATFSKKEFLYDIVKTLESYPDKTIREELLQTADKIPTSNTNYSAYVIKLAGCTPEKILRKITWSYLASIEHLQPRSTGGAIDEISNLGIARTKINSERQSMDFSQWLKKHPETKENCQKYVDRLIELYEEGVFEKYKINPTYIQDFKNTIYKISNGELDLNISKFIKNIKI